MKHHDSSSTSPVVACYSQIVSLDPDFNGEKDAANCSSIAGKSTLISDVHARRTGLEVVLNGHVSESIWDCCPVRRAAQLDASEVTIMVINR